MRGFKNYLLIVSLGIMVFNANAQFCDITPNKYKGCRGDLFEFSIVSQPGSYSSIMWNFGDGDSSSQMTSIIQHVYDTFGTFKVTVTLRDGTGKIKCGPKTVTIQVYDIPNAIIGLLSPAKQCFKGNRFQFVNNSVPGKTGAPIVSRYWDLGDGGQSNIPNPTYSYNVSGNFYIYIQIADSNGCVDTASYRYISVYPNLAPKFKTTYKISCPSTTVKFDNLTDSGGKCISKWWWDFGDGSGDSSRTNWNNQFTHTYTKDGTFNPKLYLKSCYGCIDSFILPDGARNMFYWFDIKKSASGPVCWEGNNICFSQKPRPNAYYWLWTFDDPPSMIFNTDDKSWTPCHKYTAPGFYHITLKIWEPNCVRDTTFCSFIPMKGPMAMIKLPPPAPNSKCETGKRIPISVFEAAYSTCWNPNGDPVVYATPRKVAKYIRRTDSFYCNSPVTSIDSVLKPGCDDNDIVVTKINYKLGQAPGGLDYWDSIDWYSNSWYPGDPYPWVTEPVNAKTAYYPPNTACNYKNIHDSDQYISSCRGPNLVFFPNNTIKYRLRYDIDNNAPAYTIPPGKDMSMDKCKNPSYPWGSDSLLYFWDFKDPYGDNCTSSVTKPNQNCKYSTEITPLHLYKKSGTYIAELTATDTVMGCISKDKVSIVMEGPDAGWDTSAYKKLDWYTQILNPEPDKRRGMILNGTPCVGQAFPQVPDFSETLPRNDRQKWWMVFDSVAQCSGNCKDSIWVDTNGNIPPKPNKLIKTMAVQCGWIDDKMYAMMGNKWIYGKGGCKSVGLIIKTGDCYDTFWYNQYKYIADLQAAFDILDPASYDVNYGRYMNTLDYGNKQQLNLCPPFQTIITVADTQQTGIISFDFSVEKIYAAPWTKPWNNPLKDSCVLVQSISYRLCHRDSLYIDPITKDTIWTHCFTFPSPNTNCGLKPSGNYTLQDFLSKGYFINATYKLLDLRDTLFMNDFKGNSLSEPGKYSITSMVRNLYNCYNLAQMEMIVGHYSDFTASDQVVCYEGVGDKIIFNGTIRYFQQKMYSWDPELNPINYWRDPFTPRGGSPPAAPSVIETVEWDLNGDGVYGDGATSRPDSVVWVYKQPGNYTVRMRTTDSNNCVQVLERKDFIRVMGVVADFNTTSGINVCAPQTVQFVDKSYGINTYEYRYNRYGQKIDSFLVDTVVSWKWDFGDHRGTASISNLKRPIHTFRKNGCYTISLVVKTVMGCTDTIVKSNYVCIEGPKPDFRVIDSFGYAPFTVYVKDRSKDVSKWEYVLGDNSVSTFNVRPTDSIFSLVYKTPGIYYLYLRASDSVYNKAVGSWINCVHEYGELQDISDPHFKIIVYPNSIEEAVISNEFYVYPNPFSESLNVYLPPDKKISEIELLDLSGKCISVRRETRGNNMEIFREGLPKGMYVLKIVADKVYVFKIIAE